MEILKEFLDPVPIPLLALALFGFVLLWVLAKCFRMPKQFQEKEDIRDELRFRLIDENKEFGVDYEAVAGDGAVSADEGAATEPPESAGDGTGKEPV
jgi:hypothetical protein